MSDSLSRSVVGVQGATKAWIEGILSDARSYAAGEQPVKIPAGVVAALLFAEDSTRTRCSFEMACHKLGIHPIVLGKNGSSMSKGETLLDTARLLEVIGTRVLILRHSENGAAETLAKALTIPVINAGDGTNEHPTQALLDVYTLQEEWGTFEGRSLAIVGDIRHSRVARSTALAVEALGGTVRLCGPAALCSESPPGVRATCFQDMDTAIEGVDAVMMLRIQRERMGAALSPDPDVYRRHYGLTVARAEALPPHTVVLHPAPMNRGVEIDSEVADGARSRIFNQMANGVWVRMACIARTLNE
jgi:aspartate carbamoyltransferase catalytic subunit